MLLAKYLSTYRY